MRKRDRGFSLIELLIVVAIILIIVTIAIPNFTGTKISANEAAAQGTLRAINTAEVTYNSTYSSVGYAGTLVALGQPLSAACVASPTSACLIDGVLANNGNPPGSGKSGYLYSITPGAAVGGVLVQYTALAVPVKKGQTGNKAFCATEDGITRVDPAGVASNAHDSCVSFNPASQ